MIYENCSRMKVSVCVFTGTKNRNITNIDKKSLPSFHSLVSRDFFFNLCTFLTYLMNDSQAFSWNCSRINGRQCVFTSFFYKKMPSTHCGTSSLLADRHESLLKKKDRNIIMPKWWSIKLDYWKRTKNFKKKIAKT